MKLTRVPHVFAALLISVAAAFGQTAAVPAAPTASPEAIKSPQEIEKKAFSLLERTIGDADSLRLPENRVYVVASAAAMLWSRDEKRARQLYRRAANEISAVAAGTEENGDELPENFWALQNIRNQFLNSLSNRDAELALEILRQTRLPIYERMLNLPSEKIKLYRNLYQQAQSELILEKDFAARMIKQNPRRALEIARATLSKGATYSDINLINHLKKTEPELASKFAGEVLQKLLGTDLTDQNDYNIRSLTQTFLIQFTEPPDSEDSKEFKIDKNALRRLAVKYADYFSSTNFQPHAFYDIQNSLPIFERVLPERVAALRQKIERLKQSLNAQDPHNQYQEQFNQLANKAAAETLVEEAENFPSEMRGQIFSSAANKMANAGNYAAGRQLLVSLPGKQAKQSALLQYDLQNLQKFLTEGKIAEAEQIIAQQIDASNKIRLIVLTAGHFSSQKQNEKASEYLALAHSMVNPNPENYSELTDLLQVLSAGGDSEKSFDLLESFVPKFNEIFAAAVFLSKYQPGDSSFRSGELVISNASNRIYFNGNLPLASVSVETLKFDRLGKANLERAISLADRFDRSDVRIAARIMILRGVLIDEKNADSQFPSME